jgi:membrane-bound serine protease (ClpP class)
MDPLLIAILCFLLAVGLAAADLLLPSGGALALTSLLSAVASVYIAFRSGHTAGAMMLMLILVAIPVFLVAALRVWPHTPIGRMIILRTPAEREASVHAAAEAEPLLQLVGQVGITQNSLLPSGHVRIDHHNYNALCDCGVIEAGQIVEVVAIRQRNLVVVPTTVPIPARPRTSHAVESKVPRLGESLLDRPPEDLGLDSLEG